MTLEEGLFALTRIGIGHQVGAIFQFKEWEALQTLANQQGLAAIVLDGIDRLSENNRPPKEFTLQWIGEVLQGYEFRYEACRRTLGEMAGFYNSHGYKMMVLKGFACSLNWPKPEHRPCGDIDIWQFGESKSADSLLTSEKGIKVDKTHHHHTVFYWRDFMVENHFDFINVYHHKSNVELEKVLKELGKDDSHFVEVYGEKVYLPSPNLHALFLLKHTMNDFTAFSMTLRQLIDWGLHIEKNTKEIDWDWFLQIIEKYHMKEFFNIISAICVEDLGFSSSIFPSVQFNPLMKEKVLADILKPAFSVNEPKGLLPRLDYKFKRWRENSWKHKMCYNESMWSAFWSGVWSHMLKPKSI